MKAKPDSCRSIMNLAKIATWFNTHKDLVGQMTRAQVARKIQTDIGLNVSAHSIAQFEESIGVKRIRGNAACDEARKDRLHVIAKSLADFMDTFGYVVPDELKDIVDRK